MKRRTWAARIKVVLRRQDRWLPRSSGRSPGRGVAALRTLMLTSVWLGLATPGAAASGTVEEALLAQLRQGGHVLLIRHAATVPGTGDPPGFRLDECATQRNLSDAGRAEARRLGEHLRAAAIPVAEVRSSAWCRSLDTARLAFEPDLAVQHWAPLDSFFRGQGDGDAQTRAARAEVARVPGDANWVWVTHQVNITALTGIHPAMGEVVVVRPTVAGDGLAVVGRWRPG